MRFTAINAGVLSIVLSIACFAQENAGTAAAALPLHLRDTGLFAPDSVDQIAANNLSVSPQYPLWSDGAVKRRWLYLPPGTHIDASNPDAWDFPRGTRLWKEFSFERRIETRYIERLADGSWQYASYIWNDSGTDAVLAASAGVTQTSSGYQIPSREDCRACHEGGAVPVLGVSALQLSRDRDALAPHAEKINALDLNALVKRGLIVNLPASWIAQPPRIAAVTERERAALGYLHGNCGECHNDDGPLAVLNLSLAQSASHPELTRLRTLESIVNALSDFRFGERSHRVIPGNADASVLPARMRSRDAVSQMPPLGSRRPDTQAIALIEHWINQDLSSPQE
ncbi:MAG: hypothetical protein ACJ8MH_01210 [Povalibacter sp.]